MFLRTEDGIIPILLFPTPVLTGSGAKCMISVRKRTPLKLYKFNDLLRDFRTKKIKHYDKYEILNS